MANDKVMAGSQETPSPSLAGDGKRRGGHAKLWGSLMLLLGVLTMLVPFAAGLAVAVAFGVILLVAGSFELVYAFQARRFRRGAGRFLLGAVSMALGIYFVTQSDVAAAALGLLLAAYLLADGCLTLGTAWQAQAHSGWLVFYGLSTIALGALLWLGWPLTGIIAVGVLFGIRLVIAGILMLMLEEPPSTLLPGNRSRA